MPDVTVTDLDVTDFHAADFDATDLDVDDLNVERLPLSDDYPPTTDVHQWQDQHGRFKSKLRLSLTDRCNFRCEYCMPTQPEWFKKTDLMQFDELLSLCDVMVQSGIRAIRLTGGEPLMRPQIDQLILRLQALRPFGLRRISMTSNGFYLERWAQALRQAGLDDLNISLDSLDPQQFEQLTRQPLQPVLDGIVAAQAAGLPIKLNCVLIRGRNDDQIIPMTRWAMQKDIPLRFIEYMPLDGDGSWQAHQVVTELDILQQLSEQFAVSAPQQAHEPARTYWLDGRFPVGIISTISHAFCGDCDRVRINARGELFTCLFSQQGTPLRPAVQQVLQSGQERDRQLLRELIGQAIWHKPRGYHELAAAQSTATQPKRIAMYRLGG